jgi:hypothetical protein
MTKIRWGSMSTASKAKDFTMTKRILLLILLLFVALPAWAATAVRYDNIALNQNGKPLVNVSVAVYPTSGANVFTITAATSSGYVSTITTSAPHGFTVGQMVSVANVDNVGYDGIFTITAVPTTTTFTYTNSYANLTPSTDGMATVTLAALYTDRDEATTSNNPFTTDLMGNYGFWTNAGYYIVQIYTAGIVYRTMDVFVFCDPTTSCGGSTAGGAGGNGGSFGNGPPSGSCTAGQSYVDVTDSLLFICDSGGAWELGNGVTIVSSPPTVCQLSTLTFATSNNTLYVGLTGNVCTLAGGGTLNSAIIYVSDSGNDSNDGLSWGTAKKTEAGACAALPSGNSGCTAGSGTIWIDPNFSGTTFVPGINSISIIDSFPHFGGGAEFGYAFTNFTATASHDLMILNNAATGTTLNNTVCKDSSENAIICSAGVTQGVAGIALNGAGKTGYVQVCVVGFCPAAFDNSAVAGDWAIPSTTVAGEVHDTGSTILTPNVQNFLVDATQAGPGAVANIEVFTPDQFIAQSIAINGNFSNVCVGPTGANWVCSGPYGFPDSIVGVVQSKLCASVPSSSATTATCTFQNSVTAGDPLAVVWVGGGTSLFAEPECQPTGSGVITDSLGSTWGACVQAGAALSTQFSAAAASNGTDTLTLTWTGTGNQTPLWFWIVELTPNATGVDAQAAAADGSGPFTVSLTTTVDNDLGLALVFNGVNQTSGSNSAIAATSTMPKFSIFDYNATDTIGAHLAGIGGTGAAGVYSVTGKWVSPDGSGIAIVAIKGTGTLPTGPNKYKPFTASQLPADLGAVNADSYATSTNCISKASPAACGTAAAGMVTIAAGATTVVVDTTAVTATSEIHVTDDESLGTPLSVTCNTQGNTTLGAPRVTARTAGTSFTIAIDTGPTTNPECIVYSIRN